MKITSRTQVYWRNGRLYPVKNTRPTGKGPWPPISGFYTDELVAIIEGDVGYFEITEGPSATRELVDKAFLLHRDIPPESISLEVWKRIPNSLRTNLSAMVSDAESKVSNQWGHFSNEEAITGAFFSRLKDASFEEKDGWKIDISFVEFSKQTKEPLTGTDIAVVIDALAKDGTRSFKTLWFQSKTAKTKPSKASSLPRMNSQLTLAKTFCQSSYGLIYTPEGIFVLREDGPQPFHTTLDRCIQCHDGDPSVAVLKNSLNRKKLLQIVFTEEHRNGSVGPSRRLIKIRRNK